MPWPTSSGQPDKYAYQDYLHAGAAGTGTAPVDCRAATTNAPGDLDCGDWHSTSKKDPLTPPTSQELGGVMGPAIDHAYDVTTGRPDIHVSVLDSGIMWDDGGAMRDLRRKVAINWAELPPPEVNAAGGLAPGCTPASLPSRTTRVASPGFPIAALYPAAGDCYDVNHDGVFNVDDYGQDPRVNPASVVAGGVHDYFCHLCLGAQSLLTPEDLIEVFSCFNSGLPLGQAVSAMSLDGGGHRHCANGAENVDNDNNGFPHDIAGWNFMEHTNDPMDEPHYGHGTGEARDSNAEANNAGDIGTCPSCMVLPLKVGDSFIADANDFAQAVMYATDNGVSVVQEALGTLNTSAVSQAAIDYAYRNGVTVIASAADEEAGHHNQPGSTENHTVVVNSVRKSEANDTIYGGISDAEHAAGLPTLLPPQFGNTYLLLNGCTNYGGHTVVAVESGSCSSEATGKSAGYAALMYAEACNLAIKANQTSSCRRGVDISPNEVKQVLAGTADDINFEDATNASHPRREAAAADATSACANQTDLPGLPGNYATTNAGERFKSISGWDQYFGYGRANASCAIRAVANGTIPPEADITSPGWFHNLDTTVQQSFPVVGHVAAPRAASYTYQLQLAYGVQPHESDWQNVGPVSAIKTGPVNGQLGTITKAQIDAAFAAYNPATYGHLVNPNGDQTDWLLPPYTLAGNTGKNQWDQYTFTLRLQVHDNLGRTGEDRKTLQSHHDDSVAGAGTTVPGFPKQLNTDGASDPVLADLTGNNQQVVVFGTSSGLIHAIKEDGSELPGWPVHTAPLCDSALPDDATCPSRLHEPAFADAQLGPVAGHSYAAVLRGVAVGDLDRRGVNEVVAADSAGYVWVYEPDGSVRPGFPVHANFGYSRQGLPGHFNRDHDNRVQFGFFASPTIADLNGDGKLEVIDGSLDRHVYAWRPDGSLQPGFPVMLASPEKVASIDPVTHRVHLKPDARAFYGSKIVSSPSVGDLLGDGHREIVIGRNEEYELGKDGGYNASTDSVAYGGLTSVLGAVVSQANGRAYAVFSDGYCHGLASCPATPPDAVPANAYVPGWPVKVGIFDAEILPTVGSGIDTAPALINFNCPVDNQPGLKVGLSADVGPSYVFQSNGKSCFGQQNGHDRALGGTLQPGTGDSTDIMAASAFGMTAFGDLNGNGDIALVTPTTGLLKAADVILAAHQLGAQNQVTAWSLTTPPSGCSGVTCVPPVHAGFPHYMNDLQFLSGPAIADLNGDGHQEIVQGSATDDLRAVQSNGTDLPGWSKNTGDWTADTPTVGMVGTGTHKRVASLTRDGRLFLWNTDAGPCDAASWPQARHDTWNSGEYETDAARPSTITDLGGSHTGDTATLTLTAPHADLLCGDVSGYEVRYSTTGPITAANWAQATRVATDAIAPVAAGQPQSLTVHGLPTSGRFWVEVQAVNHAGRAGGNLGAISNNVIFNSDAGPGSSTGGPVASPGGGLPNTGAGAETNLLMLLGLAVAGWSTRLRRRPNRR